MLSSGNRLRKKSDIAGVFRGGWSAAGNFIFLRFAKNNLNTNRFAFVVSSKVSPKSVSRNRIKRILREAVKKNIPKIKPGFDFIIIAKPEIIDKKPENIQKEINEIFDFKFNRIIQKKHF